MNSDTNAPSHVDGRVAYTYDSANKLIMTSELITSIKIATYNDPAEPHAEQLQFEHDRQNRLFVVTLPDGKTERFRDNPVRHLIVEPDPQSGEMRPVIKHGQPAYLYLSREEREL